MRKNYLAKQKRQFKGLCKKMTKSWNTLSNDERKNLLSRFRRLYSNLKTIFVRPSLRKMMGTAAMLLITMGGVQAQQFAAGVQNPFGLTNVGSNVRPSFGDIDNDGDYDLIVGNSSGDFYFFENTGTNQNPNFASAAVDTFGLSTNAGYISPSLVDIDDDGDFDIFYSNYFGEKLYRPNLGTAANPSFSSQSSNPFNLSNNVNGYNSYVTSAFVDIDNDGDIDILEGNTSFSGGNPFDFFLFYENTGSATAPSFGASVEDTFNLSGVGQATPTFVDIDKDGDMDMFTGSGNGSYFYFENTGSATAPSFTAAVQDTFGLSDVGNGGAPVFVDIDNDGDMDMFTGVSNGTLYFFENLDSTVISSLEIEQEQNLLSVYPNPVAEELTIEFPESRDFHIQITDLTGREIYSASIQAQNNLQLSTTLWPAGLYLLSVQNEDGDVETKKIVKH